MKASDFTTGGNDREKAMSNLLKTEKTDAVNTGLVEKADKSAKALKGDLYSVGKKGTHGAGSTALDAIARKRKKTSAADALDGKSRSQITGKNALTKKVQSRHNLNKSLKHGAKGVAAKAAHNALKDSELEGTDDLVATTHTGAKLAGKARKHLRSGKDALEKKDSLGALSEKKYRTEKLDKKAAQKRMQFSKYFHRNVYENAAAQAGKKKALTILSGGIKALFVPIAGAIGQFLPFLIAFLLAFGVIAAFSGGAAYEDSDSTGSFDFGNLSGVQLEVAKALADAGLSREAICGAMGNIAGESSWNVTAEYKGKGGEYGYGLFQFTDKGGTHNYTNFVNWCNKKGKRKDSASAQTEYFLTQLKSSWMTGLVRTNFYHIPKFSQRDASYASWKTGSDLEFETFAFMACYERPASGAGHASYYSTRLPKAKEYYKQITVKYGSAGSKDFQKMFKLWRDNEKKWRYGQGGGRLNPPSSGYSDCSACIWWAIHSVRPDIAKHVGAWTGAMATSGKEIARGTASTPIDTSKLKPGDIVLVEWKHVNYAFNDGSSHVEWYVGNNTLWGAGYGPLPHKSGNIHTYLKRAGCWMVRRVL